MPATSAKLSEFERERVRLLTAVFVESRRPPVEVRNECDVGFSCTGEEVVIFELRPRYKQPGKVAEMPVARTKYVRTRRKWKIFWMRSDLKWHGYEPRLWVDDIEDFLNEVESDPHCCFWG